MVWRIFFSISSPSLEVMSEAINPCAMALACIREDPGWKHFFLFPTKGLVIEIRLHNSILNPLFKILMHTKINKSWEAHCDISTGIFPCNSLRHPKNSCFCLTIISLPYISIQTHHRCYIEDSSLQTCKQYNGVNQNQPIIKNLNFYCTIFHRVQIWK